MLGKLLGHGQFGYTYVATDKVTGDRVAVKRIDKNKVRPLELKNSELLSIKNVSRVFFHIPIFFPTF